MAASSIPAAAMEQTPLLGDTTVKPPKKKFNLRPAHLSDLPIMAVLAKDAYWLSAVNRFLAPRAEEHPEDMVRLQLQGIQKNFATANNLSLVACVPAQDGEDEIIVGCGQFSRKGSDKGAKNFVKNKGWSVRIALWVLGWWFWISNSITNRIWPDRIFDIQALKDFHEWVQMDIEKYWKQHPERDDRWTAASVVVSPAYQGKGIGRLLMCHVMEIAQQEGVPMGLTASPSGEKLYQKLGFQMLGDFSHRAVNDEGGGGIMIWYPQGWEGKRHDLA
jgi:ribosomal protein S18 acetylase RimI-like enzyme